MATGMAIMGFGGGAMIGSPLASLLMDHFASNGVPSVTPALVGLGVIYFVFMSCRRIWISRFARGLAARRLDAIPPRMAQE